MTHTIQALTAETAPLGYNGPNYDFQLTGEYAEWPDDLQHALRSLCIEQHDSGSCEVCDTPVGFTLGGVADEIQKWHWATFAQVDGEIHLLCEDCEAVLHTIGASV